METCPPVELTEWIAVQERVPAGSGSEHRGRIAGEIDRLARRCIAEFSGKASENLAVYRGRLWRCLEYHWRSFSESGPIRFADVRQKIEQGQLHYGRVESNVLVDVALAVALQQGEPRAAEKFEAEFMPLIRAIAGRIGGTRAVEAVENFSAELTLPRGDRPPRISTYQGRTPLTSWLRSVVVNFWTSRMRKAEVKTVSAGAEPATFETPERISERTDCEGLLEPLFRQVAAALDPEDRVLIQMLILDDVPQKHVARSLNCNSGTITRRRQRAGQQMLSTLQQLTSAARSQQRVTDCLELALTDNDLELRRSLGDLLAQAITTDPSSPEGRRLP